MIRVTEIFNHQTHLKELMLIKCKLLPEKFMDTIHNVQK